jgi:hypothetical protein
MFKVATIDRWIGEIEPASFGIFVGQLMPLSGRHWPNPHPRARSAPGRQHVLFGSDL